MWYSSVLAIIVHIGRAGAVAVGVDLRTAIVVECFVVIAGQDDPEGW